MDSPIELIKVSSYSEEGLPLFEEANLRLAAGERVLVTAPVASGKSVFLKLLAGLMKPEKGVVFVLGQDVSELEGESLNALRRRMGFVFQDNILISNLKVIENVALPMLYHTEASYEEAMERARGLLDLVGFRGDVWELPGPLPLYARKEVAIARALALDPQIIICENIWDFLKDDEKAHLSELLLRYHLKAEGRVMVFTANSEQDEGYMRPHRVVRIECNGFRERV